jgi:hypothetical protein
MGSAYLKEAQRIDGIFIEYKKLFDEIVKEIEDELEKPFDKTESYSNGYPIIAVA